MSYIRKIVITLCLLSGMCASQTVGSSDPATIRLLVEQVKELQESVKALRAKQRSPPVASPEAPPAEPVPPQPIEEAVSTAQTPTAFPAMHDLHGIQWRGFAEFNYKVFNQRAPELGTFGFEGGSAGSFYTGDFDLLLTSRINERTGILAEIALGEGDAQTLDVDLERVFLKYDHGNHFSLMLGRYHTAVGYYNRAFESGKWQHMTADRPVVMEFAVDGGLLPTHAVGASASGLIPSGALGLNYLVEYGSSDTIRPEINGSDLVNDENRGNHISLGLFLRPDGIAGLQVGGSYYHDKISAPVLAPHIRFGQAIVNAHVVYVRHGIEFLNEGFLIRHSLEESRTVFNMPAFYSQFSKRFGSISPFFRYQYVNANPHSIFEDVLLRQGPSLVHGTTLTRALPSRRNWTTHFAKACPIWTACNCNWHSPSEYLMRKKWVTFLLLSWLLAVPGVSPCVAQNIDVAVVVNESNSVSMITMAQLRKVFSGEKRYWAGGIVVKLVVRAPGTHERLVLLKLLGMSESEYKQYWSSQVLRGEAQAEPLTLPSVGMQKEALTIFPGAIALTDLKDVKPSMKVLKLDGRMPLARQDTHCNRHHTETRPVSSD